MGRLLVLVVLAVLAVWLIRRALLGAARVKQGEAVAPSAKAEGDLVKCAHCGTHLPLAEAKAVSDRLYCSDEHARLGPRAGPGNG